METAFDSVKTAIDGTESAFIAGQHLLMAEGSGRPLEAAHPEARYKPFAQAQERAAEHARPNDAGRQGTYA